jgi:dephospho-CoA kinase
MRVGLTGGIGSGKSEAAAMLARLGACVIDTDALAREAVAQGTAGLAEIARAWPQVVRDGALDRAALADIVFAEPSARERLNAIVHPIVRRLAGEREALATPGQLVVHVVPLLFETGYDATLDATIVVVADDALRLARVAGRDRTDEAHVRARMAAQIDPQRARELAGFVIENDGDIEHLRRQVERVYDVLTASG